MSLQEIEAAITRSPANEPNEFAMWFREHHRNVWDRQIADDLEAGHLDTLLNEVDKEYAAGLAKPL